MTGPERRRGGRRLALLSAADKTGLVEIGRALAEAGCTLLSTGGTARALRAGGLEVEDVAAYTGFPEIMDGRVKTLHPKVHGGILARLEQDLDALSELGIEPIDFVVANLYPFERAAAGGVEGDALIEEIDIGGPAMIRAAAKNHARVTVVVDPEDYGAVAAALAERGEVPLELRRRLAAKAFARTSAYDAAIAARLGAGGDGAPEWFGLAGRRVRALRYGENPHQKGGFYAPVGPTGGSGLAGARVLGGKELSYNNLLDLDAAWRLIAEFPAGEGAACAVLKHNNPCGAALAGTLAEAWERALAGDPLSAFGSIVAVNQRLDRETAEAMAAPGNFLEAVIAPDFDEDALEALRGARFGKNLRLLAAGVPAVEPGYELRTVLGGFLVQERDAPRERPAMRAVTSRAPDEALARELEFAWRVAKHVRSNAIVLAKNTAVVGVGAGQMSRVDSVEIAARKAGERARGSVLASDAFFPFPDGIEKAAAAGVTAVIQPGGSRRDAEVVARAEELGLVMVMTGIRHFRH